MLLKGKTKLNCPRVLQIQKNLFYFSMLPTVCLLLYKKNEEQKQIQKLNDKWRDNVAAVAKNKGWKIVVG